MKALLFAVAAVFFAGCFNPTDEGSGEDKYSSKTQEIVVCSSDCAPPTYDGNPVACASNIYCYSDAAGAYCLNSNNTWSSATCRTGTTQPYCGDGICQMQNGEGGWNCSDCCPRWQSVPCSVEP